MQFVKTEDLKVGMRLARPIYNKNGVLLYERDSKLTTQGIISIRNFGLIGMFILEPAEPVPPMTAEDIEFERFQTVSVFAIQEELQRILQTKKAQKIQTITASVLKNYGSLDHKINFIQNLRSKEDYIFKHVLNVSILCAVMSHVLKMSPEEQNEVVTAALVHDLGKLAVAKQLSNKTELSEQEEIYIQNALMEGYELIDDIFGATPNVRRICVQSEKGLEEIQSGENSEAQGMKFVLGSKVLMTAEIFDVMTAMQYGKDPESPVNALRYIIKHGDRLGLKVVKALIRSINILSPGVCVELSTGEKGLVISPNEDDILRPVILTFRTNEVLDLSMLNELGDVEVTDIMRTMDNRYVMDMDSLKKSGFIKDGMHFASADEAPKPMNEEEGAFVESEFEEKKELEEESEYVPGRDE